jgi:hypothetical protein
VQHPQQPKDVADGPAAFRLLVGDADGEDLLDPQDEGDHVKWIGAEFRERRIVHDQSRRKAEMVCNDRAGFGLIHEKGLGRETGAPRLQAGTEPVEVKSSPSAPPRLQSLAAADAPDDAGRRPNGA